ncbi:MAG: ASCH domain-containing protein [Tabrizicola sp.]|jgi:uncharacterized protein YhfF|nr:ASCH domain-containing protein [Tabrizicola sp.]
MPEGLTPDQAAFWAAFKASPDAPPDADARFHSAFGIGAGSDEGAAEIVSGRKTTTSSQMSDFAPGAAPVAGSLSLLTGAEGRPVAIIETVWIGPLSLDQMDADFIAAYGEWDDPEAFRAGMLQWYQELDRDFTASTPLLAERFRKIWP